MSSRLSSERGAILVHVAVASIAIVAFSMFVIDYGVLWVSRNQAQNSADAGALAGAVALAFDDFTNRADDGPAKLSAQQVALANGVFGEAPDVQIVDGGPMDVLFYDEDSTKFPAVCADDTCIRVDVYRNQARANPLPMMFGQLVGLTDQGVRATATARAVAGNAAKGVRPWSVADKWDEEPGNSSLNTWTQLSTFDLVATQADSTPDGYVQHTASLLGTGFARTDQSGNLLDYGYQFILRHGSPGTGNQTFGVTSSGWVHTLDLPNASAGGGQNQVTANISGSTDAIVTIAEPNDPCLQPSLTVPNGDGQIIMTCIGVQPGNAWTPQEAALVDWIGDDIGDRWNPSLNNGKGGPADANDASKSGSRRIVPLALFDPAHYVASGATGSNGVVKVVNILGFFVEGTCGGRSDIDPPTPFTHESYLYCPTGGQQNDMVGRLVTIPGELVGIGGGGGGFTQVIRLIR